MKHEKKDGLIFIMIEEESSLYDILFETMTTFNELIPYEKMDMGLNRLISNNLVGINKENYSFTRTEKGNSMFEEYKKSNMNFDCKRLTDLENFLNNVEMDKEPEGLGFMLSQQVYISTLELLKEDFTEEDLGIYIWKPKPYNPNAYKPSKSKEIINKIIEESNITKENFNLDIFCDVIRKFMKIEFNAEDDDLLYETEVFFKSENYEIYFTRQFAIYNKATDNIYITQLHIRLEYENNYVFDDLVNEKTSKLKGNGIWSMDYENLDVFFQNIKLKDSYKIASEEGNLKNISISYTRV
ncbi:hypothetical protein RJI07_03610 [Mycoplasmatota bacterium WC30]